jgi:hypothetical protein
VKSSSVRSPSISGGSAAGIKRSSMIGFLNWSARRHSRALSPRRLALAGVSTSSTLAQSRNALSRAASLSQPGGESRRSSQASYCKAAASRSAYPAPSWGA